MMMTMMMMMSYLISLFLLPFVFVFLLFFPSLILGIMVYPSLKWRMLLTGPFWKLFSLYALKFVLRTKTIIIDRRNESEKKQKLPPGLYIANHQSLLDIPLVLKLIQIAPIMKKELFYVPFFGLAAWASGTLMVNRSNKKSRALIKQKASDRLLGGPRILQYYPEGTRNRESLAPKSFEKIKTPLMSFAYQNGIKIYPMSIYGTHQLMKVAFKPFERERTIALLVHQAMDPKDYQNEDEFLKASWQKVIEGHLELQGVIEESSKLNQT